MSLRQQTWSGPDNGARSADCCTQQACFHLFERNSVPMDDTMMMTRLFHYPVDMSKVSTLIYHLPDGPALSVEMEGSDFFFDLDMELGEVCDTSDIDGVLHFFPKGNA
jgi:hypothetical protein